MGLRITVQDTENPYGEMMCNFFAQDFPGANATEAKTVLEVLTNVLVTSGRVRYGPAPSPESLVAIRSVLRSAIENDKPIPILTPWGSKKSRNYESVDVAELGAIKQLSCLNKRVLEFYKPGIEVRIRLEDASGFHLFADEIADARPSTIRYCEDLQTLVRVLGVGGFIDAVLESSLFDEVEYARTADAIIPLIMAYLSATDTYGFDNYQERAEWRRLAATGWQGSIPAEQRNYYRQRYRATYPGVSDYDATVKLARYLAGSLARIKHKGSGAAPAWGGEFIVVTFVPPIPGAPDSLNARKINYRTLPAKMAETHMPPWRAKGYLKIGSRICPKIASWNERLGLTPSSMLFERDGEQVSVKTDYMIA